MPHLPEMTVQSPSLSDEQIIEIAFANYEAEFDSVTLIPFARALLAAASPDAAPAAQTTAARDVLAERRRQVEKEGWTPQHDDNVHDFGELARAASCYALHAGTGVASNPVLYRGVPAPGETDTTIAWPWASGWWKPKDRRSNLVRAGALILAEIERLDRLSEQTVSLAEGETARQGADGAKPASPAVTDAMVKAAREALEGIDPATAYAYTDEVFREVLSAALGVNLDGKGGA